MLISIGFDTTVQNYMPAIQAANMMDEGPEKVDGS